MPKTNWAETLKTSQAGIDEVLALAEKEERGLTEDEQATLKAHEDVADDARKQVESLQAAKVARARHQDRQAFLSSPLGRITQSGGLVHEPGPDGIQIPSFVTKSRPLAGRLEAFTGSDAQDEAYYAGKWYLASVWKNPAAIHWCNLHGMPVELDALTATEGTDIKGGYLVPDFLSNAIIRLRETYGVFRQNADVVPMSTDVYKVPRETGDVTAYFVGEGVAITASDSAYDMVSLTARKIATLSYITSELAEDAIASMADRITKSIAYAFAKKEDDCGFLGTGTQATYGGIAGLITKVAAGGTYTAVAGNITFATLDLGDFEAMIGQLPSWARNPKWYIHKTAHAASMLRLADAAGGNTMQNIAGGAPQTMFLGYPVVFCPSMTSTLTTLASTGGMCYFGDLAQAVMLGERRGLTVDSSKDYAFNQDLVAIRSTSRFDIVCHECGTASAAGSIIMLKAPAS